MTEENEKKPTHPPPASAKGWRLTWQIEAADAQGDPIRGEASLRWAGCVICPGGPQMNRRVEQLNLQMARTVEALLAQGDLAELEGFEIDESRRKDTTQEGS